MSDARETRLVLRAQMGDRDALDELFQLMQSPLYHYIKGLVGEDHLAEDVLQEVFLRIYRKLGWLREAKLFRPWCYRITTRETFRRLKRERSWRELVREEEVLQTVAMPLNEAPLHEEWIERLPEMIGQLSPASRAVMALHYLEHLTLEEIAQQLSLAIGTVKSRLAYGLSILRQEVSHE